MPYDGHGFNTFVAFTIRACCRLTLRVMSYQSMSCQPFVLWVGASVDDLPIAVGIGCANCFITAICLPTLRRFIKLSRDERPAGSLPAFAWDDVGLNLNPYPLDYRAVFAFSSILYPQFYRLALRLAFPCDEVAWENYGLTTFRMSTILWVRSDLSAGGASSTMSELGTPMPDRHTYQAKDLKGCK